MSESSNEANDSAIRVHAGLSDIAPSAWNELLSREAAPSPFMRHEFLSALVASGSASAETGWAPVALTLQRGERLDGAAVAWLKTHSYGEYMFLCSIVSMSM